MTVDITEAVVEEEATEAIEGAAGAIAESRSGKKKIQKIIT